MSQTHTVQRYWGGTLDEYYDSTTQGATLLDIRSSELLQKYEYTELVVEGCLQAPTTPIYSGLV